MGKSSSSLKRKRRNNSSKALKSSKSKSKSRRHKSKRLQHGDKYVSRSDDGSFMSTSSSSFEEGHRIRRARSRTRKDVKICKKRARRHSYSSESSEDSTRMRKRKRSKKKDDSEIRKKAFRKKKPKREASIDSLSSCSRSCSNCQGGNTVSFSRYESEFESHKGRSDVKAWKKRKLKKVRAGVSGYQSRSCSQCSQYSQSSYSHSEEKIVCENNSRRLKSVIIVNKNLEENGDNCKDECKNEIVYHNDYPFRSNDSNGGEKEWGQMIGENESGAIDDNFCLKSNGSDGSNSCEFQSDRNIPEVDVVQTNKLVVNETSEALGDTGSLNSGDLESILRQRALENLKKFRGGVQRNVSAANGKIMSGGALQQPPAQNDELLQINSSAKTGLAPCAKSVSQTLVAERTSIPIVGENLISSERNTEPIVSKVKDDNKSGSARHKLISVPNQVSAGNLSETVKESVNHVTGNLTATKSSHHSSQIHPLLKQRSASGSSQKRLGVTDSNVYRGVAATAQIVNSVNKDNGQNVKGSHSTASRSCHSLILNSTSLSKRQDEMMEHPQCELMHASTSQESPASKSSVTESGMEKDAAKTAHVSQIIDPSSRDLDSPGPGPQRNSSGGNNSAKNTQVIECSQFEHNAMNVKGQSVGHSGSNHKSADPGPPGRSLEEKSAKNLRDEVSEGSQFEQKTMNVIRGGEMVQVSYKVYIPNRPPALARRRQLKR